MRSFIFFLSKIDIKMSLISFLSVPNNTTCIPLTIQHSAWCLFAYTDSHTIWRVSTNLPHLNHQRRHRKTDIFPKDFSWNAFWKIFVFTNNSGCYDDERGVKSQGILQSSIYIVFSCLRMGRRTAFDTFHRDRTSMKWRPTWSQLTRRLGNL